MKCVLFYLLLISSSLFSMHHEKLDVIVFAIDLEINEGQEKSASNFVERITKNVKKEEPETLVYQYHFSGKENKVKDTIFRELDFEKDLKANVEEIIIPTENIVDIKKVSLITKKYNLIFVVDNTFATPYIQKPLDLGADIVMHSLTKYMGGHSDIVMGAAICLSLIHI